jgi:hypothetical protein
MSKEEDLARVREMLDGWREAEKKVMSGQSYRIGTRTVNMTDLKDIAERIRYYQNEVYKLENGVRSGIRVQGVIPRDL